MVLAARREERLAEVVTDCVGATTVSADVRISADCQRIGRVAQEVLGNVDVLLVSSGYAPLKMFSDTTAQDWRDVFETNVIGVHEVIRAHLPVLTPSAIVAVLSSDSVANPHTALGAYSSSKAALERCLQQWRIEHPGYRFSCVEVGGTVPTDFTSAFDPEVLDVALHEWLRRGLVQEARMTPEAVAEVLAGTIASAVEQPGVGLQHITVVSPTGPMRT